jgi:endonuclease/exonuclease/phosphatase family metal-dependent hydrolase
MVSPNRYLLARILVLPLAPLRRYYLSVAQLFPLIRALRPLINSREKVLFMNHSKTKMLRLAVLLVAGLVFALNVPAQTRTLRIVTYNIQADTVGIATPGIVSPTCGLIEPYQGSGGTYNTNCSGSLTSGGVLEGIGEEIVNGDPAQPIDILALQETTSNPTTVQPIVNGLNSFYSLYNYLYSTPAGYAMSPYQATENGGDTGDGNGPNALVYNTNTVQLLASVGIATPTGSGNGMYRQCVRYEFAPAGATPGTNNEFYVYVSHYKASTGSGNAALRLGEATIIRNDEAVNLPANAAALYVGDYNPDDNSSEPAYQAILAYKAPDGIAQGQGVDPLNTNASTTINWSSSTSNTNILFMLSEESYELRYRDDLQIMTSNVFYQVSSGLRFVPGTYHSFGNNATTSWGNSVNLSGNTALNNLDSVKASATGLSAAVLLEDLTGASDHLPVVADYTISLPAPELSGSNSVNFGVANVGASVTNSITITNLGGGALVLSNALVSGANAGDFTVSGISFPATIAAGQSNSFTAVFTPQGGGTRSATLQINDNDPNNNPFSIALTGTGNAGPTILWSFTNLSLNAVSDCSAAMIDVTGNNYLQASDVLGPGALTITQTPAINAPLAAGTTNQIVITVADTAGNTVYSTNWIYAADVTTPVIVSPPVSQTNNASTTASFTVAATACTALNYQWYFGTNALAGQTNSALTLASVGTTNAGFYEVTVSSEGGSTNTAPASLTVISQAPIVVAGQMTPGANGFQLMFSGTVGQTYKVLASDDLTLPQSLWTIIGTGTFANTNVIFTDGAATNPAEFYFIESP